MEFAKHLSLVFAITIAFSVTTLANSVCLQKEDGASVQCCDKREDGGSVICCSGRNSSCGMEDFVNNALCFCDEFCERAGDCCPDFESIKEPCGFGKVKRDCEVSPWSDWGPCSPRCGVGVSQRTRTVLFLPVNGGKECPALIENKGCLKQLCGGREHGFARILPYKFKKDREPSVWEKILPAPKEIKKKEKPKRSSYCVNFKVFFKHPHCKNTWADQLDPKKPICVECQHEAMDKRGKCKGQGMFGEVTLWEAVDLKNCYGGWLKIGPRIPGCKCENKQFSNFIFI
ncbi:PREDICTED: somatomedin-B and thrombospondin type-1 domain-containing protein-like [Acropora digitifera]|uniref:somatomedin-B and thrombospondin type-1 domain-containing protein-like n=1 Tax=Acropora digitifera TaxID=70779 RepID=UPI00077AE264|nr:PREDICTED: somatomedin-B and thrombospondin type-1 domain-containing protein-like [Acropora digitifera]XP_029205062.2 somatomedin-B and thrombospondin type-1 domain-containing protein-like [Acropora millepora]